MPNKPGTSASFRREKFISETAILIHACSVVNDPPGTLSDKLHHLASDLCPHARSTLILTAIRLRPIVTSQLAVGHVCLNRLGLMDPAFQAEVECALDDPTANFFERLPWKDAEARWFHELLHPCQAVGETTHRAKVLAEIGLDALAATRKEMYEFTHGLIYLCGFGVRTPSLERAFNDIAADADCALAASLDDDDFDLSAELLMTWPYLRLDWPNSARFCLDVMDRLEEEVGFLPSLSLRINNYIQLPVSERHHYVFLESYHTVYVGALFAAACLSREHIPPAKLNAHDFAHSPRPILDLLIARARPPRWETTYATLSPDAQALLAPLVATIAIRRAIVAGDLARLRAILQIVLENNFPTSPAVTQAVSLYLRFANAAMQSPAN